MEWSEHSAFVVEEYTKNGRSSITTLWSSWQDPVPNTKTIKTWVSNFRKTGNSLNRKSSRWLGIFTGLENVAAVRAFVAQSPRCSARKHAAALQISVFGEFCIESCKCIPII